MVHVREEEGAERRRARLQEDEQRGGAPSETPRLPTRVSPRLCASLHPACGPQGLQVRTEEQRSVILMCVVRLCVCVWLCVKLWYMYV